MQADAVESATVAENHLSTAVRCVPAQQAQQLIGAGTPRTLTTVAVRPAAEELLPLVYTARGRKAVTYLWGGVGWREGQVGGS